MSQRTIFCRTRHWATRSLWAAVPNPVQRPRGPNVIGELRAVREAWWVGWGYPHKVPTFNPVSRNKNPHMFKGSVGRATCLVFYIISVISNCTF